MGKNTAYHIRADGTIKGVKPANGKKFSYDELKGFVGYPVEIVPLPSGKVLVCNEEGKLNGLPTNYRATTIWKHEYPISEYPMNNDELVVGDVLVCSGDLIN